MGHIGSMLFISERCICVILKHYKKLKLFTFDPHSRNAADIGKFIEYLCGTYLAIMVIRCHIICN